MVKSDDGLEFCRFFLLFFLRVVSIDRVGDKRSVANGSSSALLCLCKRWRTGIGIFFFSSMSKIQKERGELGEPSELVEKPNSSWPVNPLGPFNGALYVTGKPPMVAKAGRLLLHVFAPGDWACLLLFR